MVPMLIAALLSGDAVPFQQGHAIRDYVYVDDVAEGFASLTDSDVRGAVNLGSGEGVRLRDFAERIAAATGRPGEVGFGELATPSHEPARVVADMTRARTELGWQPHRSLDDGIRETVAWWRSRVPPRGLAASRAAPSE
jgi:nucleoside-diphosphate-sugar epimerase